MKYNFESAPSRYGCGSNKWNEIERTLGRRVEGIIPFSVADMEFCTAPEIVQALKDMVDRMPLGYANPTDSFKQAVCGWMKSRHGWDAQPEWILVSHGVVEAFYAAVCCFTREGEGVMLMTPVYYPMYSAIRDNGRVLVDCPLRRGERTYDIDFDLLEEKARDPNTKMLILCSPHNPVGRIWTREELLRIGEICSRNGVLVVSDEIHHDLVMPGHRHYVYASLSPELEQNCLVLTAPSKTFNLAGMQTSSMLIPDPELRSRMKEYLNRITVTQCSPLGYCACEAAYRQCGGWLEECIGVIDRNRQLITDFFARHFPQIKVYDLQATYLLWMDWNGLGLDYKELERINHHEALLYLDEGYIFGEEGQGFERWNLACPTAAIEAALERMKKAYDPYIQK